MEHPDFDLLVSEKDALTGKKVVKFATKFFDGTGVESVIIPMATHDTLCVSSQVGCRYNCQFCTTGRGGFVRNLEAEEIVAQVNIAFYEFERPVRNIVFMGMGEPFDNFDNVFKAIDIISDPKGLNIIKRHISVSTVGHAAGLDRLASLIHQYPHRHYHTLRISLSLNATRNDLRSQLMPVNKTYPLERLKESLFRLPQSARKDGIYIEYVLIEGVNDTLKDAAGILSFIEGQNAKINLIPFNPGPGFSFAPPSLEVIETFHRYIVDHGRYCLTRKSKGSTVMAGCGQLSKS